MLLTVIKGGLDYPDESPEFEESLLKVENALLPLQGENFNTIEDARLAISKIFRLKDEHNQKFPDERPHLNGPTIIEVEIKLNGLPFKLLLKRLGPEKNPTKKLQLEFTVIDGQGPDINLGYLARY